jgi:hypothetical protein
MNAYTVVSFNRMGDGRPYFTWTETVNAQNTIEALRLFAGIMDLRGHAISDWCDGFAVTEINGVCAWSGVN